MKQYIATITFVSDVEPKEDANWLIQHFGCSLDPVTDVHIEEVEEEDEQITT